jgi:hypothetical protein
VRSRFSLRNRAVCPVFPRSEIEGKALIRSDKRIFPDKNGYNWVTIDIFGMKISYPPQIAPTNEMLQLISRRKC